MISVQATEHPDSQNDCSALTAKPRLLFCHASHTFPCFLQQYSIASHSAQPFPTLKVTLVFRGVAIPLTPTFPHPYQNTFRPQSLPQYRPTGYSYVLYPFKHEHIHTDADDAMGPPKPAHRHTSAAQIISTGTLLAAHCSCQVLTGKIVM